MKVGTCVVSPVVFGEMMRLWVMNWEIGIVNLHSR